MSLRGPTAWSSPVCGTSTSMARGRNPDGPYAAVIPRFSRAARSGRAPSIYGDGSQSRDFTCVGDVVARQPAGGHRSLDGAQVFNIGAGSAASVAALAQMIIDITGARVSPAFLDPRPGDVLHSQADTHRAADRLGFVPATDLASGLRQTAQSF